MLRSAGNALLPAALWLLLCSVRELRAEDDAGDGFEPDFHAGAHAHEEPIDPAKRAEMVDKLKKIIESVDANGDGRLSMDEIKGHVSKGVRGQMEADNKR